MPLALFRLVVLFVWLTMVVLTVGVFRRRGN